MAPDGPFIKGPRLGRAPLADPWCSYKTLCVEMAADGLLIKHCVLMGPDGPFVKGPPLGRAPLADPWPSYKTLCVEMPADGLLIKHCVLMAYP